MIDRSLALSQRDLLFSTNISLNMSLVDHVDKRWPPNGNEKITVTVQKLKNFSTKIKALSSQFLDESSARLIIWKKCYRKKYDIKFFHKFLLLPFNYMAINFYETFVFLGSNSF